MARCTQIASSDGTTWQTSSELACTAVLKETATMTAVIDQKHGLALLEKRLAQTTNDRHRTVPNAVLNHAKLEAEPVWDVDQIMATLTPNPAYHIWVNGVDVGPKGYDAVRAFYTETARARTNFLEIDLERLVVDEDCAILEGFLKQIYPGSVAVSRRGAGSTASVSASTQTCQSSLVAMYRA